MIKALKNGVVSISKDAKRCILKYGEKMDDNVYKYAGYRFLIVENKVINVYKSYKSGKIEAFSFKQY